MSQTGFLSTAIAVAALMIGAADVALAKEPLAKNLFGSKRLPAAGMSSRFISSIN